MVVVDTHCHASPYWYEPVETLLDQMNRHGVAKATLIQIGGEYDNAYLIECMRRFPGRFSVVGLVDTDRPDAPERLEEWVKQAIIGFHLKNPLEGYRRLTFMMLDADIVAVSPSSVWRVLSQAGLLSKWNGSGRRRERASRSRWQHISTGTSMVPYLNIGGTFYYLCSILDGFSRYIVNWDIRSQ